MENIKISVIIPIFNMEKYLQECLDTVLSQTLKEIEIICINDGSKDRSEEIIKCNAQKDERVVLLSQENQGVARARNNGLNIAKGKYVVFMDPDDWYPSDDTLETLYTLAERENVLICGGSFSEQTEEKLITEFTGMKSKYKFKQDGLVDYKDYQFDYGYHRFIYNLAFLKENNIYFPEYIRFQDPPFFVKAMSTAKTFYAIEKITYRYRVGTQKIIWTNKKLLHLMYGLRDNLYISGKNDLDELHKITLDRIGHNYLPWYEARIDTLPFEIVPALLDVCSYVNEDLIQDNEKYSVYWKNIYEFVKTIFYVRKDQWNVEENEIKKCEDRISELALKIYDESEIAQNESGKARYAIQEYEKKLRLHEEKGFTSVVEQQSEKEPYVSVVIPVYNVENYVKECIDSISNQTLKQIEIICVNDGSTDNSLEVLLECARKDNRIKIYQHKNSGLSATRNAGVKQASGKYIYFMDSDDILEKNALQLLYKKMEKDQLEVVYFDGSSFATTNNCDEQVKTYQNYYTRKHTYSDGIYTGAELMKEMLDAEEYRTSACLQMLKRTFFMDKQLWFEKGVLHEDNAFTFCCMLSAERAGYIRKSLFNRRVREDSIMTAQTSFAHAYGYFKNYILMNDFLENANVTYEQKVAASDLIYRVLHNARHKFTQLSVDEKYAIMGLDPYERTIFKLYIGDIDKLNTDYKDVREKLTKANRENKDLKEKLAAARKEITKRKKEKEKVLKSKNYRVGRVILAIPRKIKKLLKKIFK